MSSNPNVPIVNLGNLYLNGCNLTYIGNASFSVAAGQARDSSDVNDIVISSAVTVNAANAGVVNGIDTGALANDSFYAVYAIGDSNSFNDPGALISLSFSQPQLPFGYDMYRRIGAVLTDGSAHILDFTQRGNGVDREMHYAAAIATAITAGAATSFTAIDLSDSIPALSHGCEALLKVVLTADAGATRVAAVRDHGSSSAAGQAMVSAPASTVFTIGPLMCPCDSFPKIDYLVSNASAAVAISVLGYIDQL